jgi:predicted molibdopterin-dependent oxidoreductase YjgC
MCQCAKRMDDHLREHNYQLCRNLFEGDEAPALIEIAKINRKMRTPSMSLVGTFCPFCGVKYPERKGRGILKVGKSDAVKVD